MLRKDDGRDWSRAICALNKGAAARWLHENLLNEKQSPLGIDEFEVFCGALLEHCGFFNIKLTSKRRSGADGGIDLFADHLVDGKMEKVAIQAKRYKASNQLGTDVVQSFIGAMDSCEMTHGLLMTTSQFSDRALELIKRKYDPFKVGDFTYKIATCDHARLFDLTRPEYHKAQPFRLGLYFRKYDSGNEFVYINEARLRGVLRRAARKYANA